MTSKIAETAQIHLLTSLGQNIRIGAYVVIHEGVTLADNVQIGDHAVLGKPVKLSARSTALTKEIPLTVTIGSDSSIGAHAIILQNVEIGKETIIGDMAFVREACKIGNQSVIGQGVTVENKCTIGSRTKIQAKSYITAYTTIEDDVFIAPSVVTTNDNFMGRMDKRHVLKKGATFKKGCRVGGGVVILPRIEIGEEAFVGAGSVVTHDVATKKVVWGSPAKEQRNVPDDELLGEQQ